MHVMEIISRIDSLALRCDSGQSPHQDVTHFTEIRAHLCWDEYGRLSDIHQVYLGRRSRLCYRNNNPQRVEKQLKLE
jgi:hypothetical protein